MNAQPKAVVGVVVVGHGRTASELLHAAKGIVGPDALAGVIAVDAGVGETSHLEPLLCAAIDKLDRGAGVLVLVDLWGASPCSCARREAVTTEHRTVTLSGLNLAMLLKLAGADRNALDVEALAQTCADSGRRSVKVEAKPGDPTPQGKTPVS